ncbi:hypothetical protein K492DRAFT_174605 [Lichtheimia hyalospora FSU 10163]|nr:hypothetical protein K492DRAFT_174605 [Lichtheimia hyalospora FSU 10163]
MDHFLYHCPPKLAVWSRVYQDLLLANCTTDSISKSLFRLQFPTSPPTIASATVISITLECIWKAHWRVILTMFLLSPR